MTDEMPTGRLPVLQGGRKIGTVPEWFDPLSLKSDSFFYQPRRGDFERTDEAWIAHNSLGPGDLDAIREFRWDDTETEFGRHKRREEEHEILREVMFSPTPDRSRMGKTAQRA